MEHDFKPWSRGQWAITWALLLVCAAPLAYGVYVDQRDERRRQEAFDKALMEEAIILRGLAEEEHQRNEMLKKFYAAEIRKRERK